MDKLHRIAKQIKSMTVCTKAGYENVLKKMQNRQNLILIIKFHKYKNRLVYS